MRITRRAAIGTLLGGALEAGSAGRPPLTPLSVSANKRYLQDAAGRPFFVVGDSPQNLPIKLAIPQLDSYMAECETRGFNLLWICIDGQRRAGPFAADPGPIDRAMGHRNAERGVLSHH